MVRSRLLVLLLAPLSACTCDEVLLEIPGAASGRICDPDTGEGVGQLVVRLDIDARTVETAADGTFTFSDVATGPAVVLADVAGVERRFDVEIVAGETAIVADPACRALPGEPGTGRIEGRICNRHIGDVVVDADVSVPLEDGSALTTTTGADGTYALEDVPAGPRILVVRADGFQLSMAVEVRRDETTFAVAEGCEREDLQEDPPTPEDPTQGDPAQGDPPQEDPAQGDPAQEDPAQDPPADPPADPCAPVEVDIFLFGDCLSISCPAATPVPVGCNVLFSPGDERGCVAHTLGDSDVYFQAGDQCNAGLVGGTLLCQAQGCGGGVPVVLGADNCPINKPVDIYAADPSGCPALHD